MTPMKERMEEILKTFQEHSVNDGDGESIDNSTYSKYRAQAKTALLELFKEMVPRSMQVPFEPTGEEIGEVHGWNDCRYTMLKLLEEMR